MLGKVLWSLLILVAALAPARADWILTPKSEQAVSGRPFEVTLVLTNDSREPLPYAFPERLRARLVVRDRALDADLVAVDGGATTATLEPGHFARRVYGVVLPPGIDGPVRLELLGELAAARLTLVVEAADAVGGPALADAKPRPPVPPLGERPLDTTPQPALQTFQPMYFIVGRREGDTTAKFQLSFKYRLFDERGSVADLWAPLGKLYFAYTQTSIWNLSEESKPFADTTYSPSAFYFEPAAWRSVDGRQNLALEGGLQHASNGQGGANSRSLNIVYVRPAWRTFLDDRHFVYVAPKLWYYLDKEDNPDIQKYYGYFDLNVRAGRVDGLQVSADYRKGTTTMGAVQVAVSYPLRQPFFADAGAYLYFQYFNGYGESLLDYNVKGPAQYRFGFAIVR
jgi:phospholipase A1